jgi:hypothetical protein
MKKLFFILILFTALSYTGCSEDSDVSINKDESKLNLKNLGPTVYCDYIYLKFQPEIAGVGLGTGKEHKIYFCCGGPYWVSMTNPCSPVSKATFDMWESIGKIDDPVVGVPIIEIIDDSSDVVAIIVHESENEDDVQVIPGKYPVQNGMVYFELK